MKKELTGNFEVDSTMLDSILRVNESFDIIGRDIKIAQRSARLYFVDGFAKDEVMEKILEFLITLNQEQVDKILSSENFMKNYVPYIETDLSKDGNFICTAVLSGTITLIVDGYPNAIMIDARTYPARTTEEPEDDRVLRGSRDGFVETLIFNTALIRRRIRVPELTMSFLQVGTESKTDIVICYLENKADKKMLKKIKDKISSVNIRALTMGQESLAECIARGQWYNPFSKIRFTERPDSAAACILEGKVVVIVDNSPSVMLLPTTFFDFVQDTNDYYFPPLVGTYLRLSRIIIFFLTLFLTPVWYLLIKNPDIIPPWLDFIKVAEPNSVPIIAQLLIIELVVDGIKLASLNTPSSLSNSFSIVGALVLGDFAIKARWFVPEVVLYMAFVAIANYTQPSFELGYAFKLLRVFLLVLTALLNVWGFVLGLILIITLLATAKTVTGVSYMYPVIPFDKAEFTRLFLRNPISNKNS